MSDANTLSLTRRHPPPYRRPMLNANPERLVKAAVRNGCAATLLVALGLTTSGCSRTHDKHAKHEHDLTTHEQHGSTASPQYAMTLSTATEPSAGIPTTLKLEIKTADGKPLGPVEIMHEKRFHIIAVSRELDFFGHEHSNEADGKPLEVSFTFPRAGHYRVFAEFTPAGQGPQRLVGDLEVSGEPTGAPRLIPDDLGKPKEVGEFEVHLTRDGHTLDFRITRKGQPVTLTPYLGAAGHVIILGEGAQHFVHSHPEEGSSNGRARFHAMFPEAGRYKLFGEFVPDGKPIVAEIVLEVTAEEVASTPDPAHHAH